MEGINVRNVLNRKKAWLKYYEWEYMVVWNLSLCVRFEHMEKKKLYLGETLMFGHPPSSTMKKTYFFQTGFAPRGGEG